MPRGINDYDTARLQGRLWTPIVLRPDFWFDAADPGTVTVSSNNVTQWRDKSGNGRHLSTGSLFPSYRLEGKNGLNVLSFSDDSLVATGLSINYTQQSTFVAVRPDTSISIMRIWTQSDAGDDFNLGGNEYIPLTRVNDPVIIGAYTNGNIRSSFTIESLTWNILDSVRDASQVQTAVNGTLQSAYSTVWPGRTFTRFGITNTIGGGGTNNYTGDYAEAIVLPIATSFRERSLVQGYLAWKWAIPLAADHPFANRPPLIGD